MTHFPQPHPSRRAPRVQLGGTVPAAVLLDDGNRTRGKLQSISTTGGMLHLTGALRNGDFVEVTFETKSGRVQGMAEMLNPRKASEGCHQPFRFIALSDDDHKRLRLALDSVLERNFIGLRFTPTRSL
ncbi:MAG TPA: PilZ domain-containing protein [Terriglobales bacterium]|nr:PilZ domain-containing protein [Terriglobales bacterium]